MEPIVRGEPVEVADGVFVIPDGRVRLVPNIGIVVGTRAALVVDTGLGPRNGALVLARARRLAGDRPLYLTTTHFHPEHGFGAQAFQGHATFVASSAQRDEAHRKSAAFAGMFRGLGPAVAAELADFRPVAPDLVYTGDRAEIDLGGRTAVLRHVGPAHTAGDQVVLADGVLFTGDLVENRMFPIAPYFPPHDTDVDVVRWIAVLDELLRLDPAVVVPGHGEVADVALVRAVRDYFDHVRGEVSALRAAGAGVDEAVSAVTESARSRWGWDNLDWIGLTVRALHR
ncbi:MBL fold metallo-hydrolase [Saccharothrix obliqua]|uniref:MBL fold metallo-hydrolase n=1 Tax=Saccharothrix obliqua TaxID=2861747 RepID=UPI001C5F7BA9|nr:MBL fold metallo-hydrolase [Saccharothrix obliqua]MBW4720385.1 MBL fold metallo-hydrolase [Saccharothrix obliqua]